jgi:hypothetical protein
MSFFISLFIIITILLNSLSGISSTSPIISVHYCGVVDFCRSHVPCFFTFLMFLL